MLQQKQKHNVQLLLQKVVCVYKTKRHAFKIEHFLGFAFATATEDADALTFGSSKVIRHLNFSDQYAKTKPILVFSLDV
jgi:predicted protein tyrosine phosphatase